MARTTRPLTNTEVLRTKALEKDLTLHDGDGLFLIVKQAGKAMASPLSTPVNKAANNDGARCLPCSFTC